MDTIASHKDCFCRYHYYSKNLCQFYSGDRVWIRDYRKVNTKWIEGQVVKKISDVMCHVKLDCNNSIIQRHVDQLRHMPVIDDIYDNNKQQAFINCMLGYNRACNVQQMALHVHKNLCMVLIENTIENCLLLSHTDHYAFRK